jgi:hypothetical protein
MIQNRFAFLSNTVLSATVLVAAQAGSASAMAVTNPTGQTDKLSIVPPAQVEQLADSRSQVKDDDKKEEHDEYRNNHKDGEHEDKKDDEEIKKLPKSVSSSIFKDLTKRTGKDMSVFRIVKVEKQEWSDGCLGLTTEGMSCTQAIVPGYQVVVMRNYQYWVYRTNESGSLVSYDETVSRTLTARSTVEMMRQQQIMTRSTQVRTTSTQMTNVGQSSTVAGSTTSVAGTTSMSSSGMTASASSTLVSFKDVSSTYWASSFISELTKLTIVKGFPDGTFRPNEVVTKAQFAAIVRKAFERAKVRDAIAFQDVSEDYWAYSAIREAYEMGYFEAKNDAFDPTLRLTRLDVLIALATALNYTTTTNSVDKILSVYSDAASIPTSYRSLIAALTERGIIVNYPNTSRLELTRVATRSEVSAFVYQTLTTIGKVQSISSPYVVEADKTSTTTTTTTTTATEGKKRHCNQGIGNGSEGCDPGNSHPHGGSNDEGGRTPGHK